MLIPDNARPNWSACETCSGRPAVIISSGKFHNLNLIRAEPVQIVIIIKLWFQQDGSWLEGEELMYAYEAS